MDMTDEFQVSAGWKYEHRDLTKLYVLCNYWLDETCYLENGAGVVPSDEISSENPLGLPPGLDESFISEDNVNHATDYGAYVQGVWDRGSTRLNAGIRLDDNSDYGPVWNPRAALMVNPNARVTYKLAYGESFQEPSPKDLFGGWNGRLSNMDLVPEKARNLEFIFIHQGDWLMQDTSMYLAEYENAIAGAKNVGDREVFGIEYRARFRIPNWFENAADISGEFNYTYTDSISDQQFNNALGIWETSRGETGDIAPHKAYFNLNVPFMGRWNANIGAKYVSERELFSQNPLRADSNPDRVDSRKAEAFTTVDANLRYEGDRYEFGFRVENIFEEDYLLPGVESASSGDNFESDFDGFQNSLIPQVNTRVYSIVLTIKM